MCGALVIDGKVMIAQRNYGSSQGFFEFPGGKVGTMSRKRIPKIDKF